MKKTNLIIILLISFLFNSVQSVNAQCKEFIESIAPAELTPYVIDGNFLSPVLYEGDEISLTRTFLAGQQYKIQIVGMNIFAKEITITDNDGFIVYKNYAMKKSEKPSYFTNYKGEKIINFGCNYWEYKPEQSQNLKITVKVEQKAKSKNKRMRGCMGIVIGFMPD